MRRAGFLAAVAVGVMSMLGVASAGTDPSNPSNSGPPPQRAGTLAAAPDVAAQATASNGTLYFSRDNESELYTLDVNTAAPTLIGTTGVTSNTVGLAESPDPTKLYGSTWTDLTVINADGSGFATTDDNQLRAEGLAYDPVNNLLYKILNEAFATADQTTGATVTNLTSPGEDLEGLAWRGTDGRIYGIGADSDGLFAYTPGADTWAAIGPTGIPPEIGAGLAWDPIADVLYAIMPNESNEILLYRIDPNTAATTLIGSTGISDEGGGLAFIAAPTPQPPPSAPTAAVPVAGEPRFTG